MGLRPAAEPKGGWADSGESDAMMENDSPTCSTSPSITTVAEWRLVWQSASCRSDTHASASVLSHLKSGRVAATATTICHLGAATVEDAPSPSATTRQARLAPQARTSSRRVAVSDCARVPTKAPCAAYAPKARSAA